MKRLLFFATLVAFAFCSSASDAAKVTIKTSPKKLAVSQKSAEEQKEAETENSISMTLDVAEAESQTESAEEKPQAVIKKTAQKQSAVEDLMKIPSEPLAPMTDAERDAKYPVVPQALEMTLQELTPTKELRNIRVLKAMARIPRAEFVPKDYRMYAYEDAAIPIGGAQTISPPFIVAYMTETLDPQPTDRVLEIGTGSGYQAAVLSCLVSEVYTIEIVKSLGRRAAETLKRLKYNNVFVRLGDGYQGWEEAGPFDKIIVTCSPEDIPQPLIDQLKEGGKMLIPIGERYLQYFVLCEKKNGELVQTTLTPANFVPMTGEAEALRREKPDPTAPSLIGGDFESINPTPGEVKPTATWKTDDMVSGETANASDNANELDELAIKLPPRRPTPVGWFATRNIYVAEKEDAYEGKRVCVCDNASIKEEHEKKDRNAARFMKATLPENRTKMSSLEASVKERQREQEAICHLRQNFAIDGTAVKRIVISGAFRVDQLRANVDSRSSVTLIKLYFFDKDRKPVRNNGEVVVLAAEIGACPWQEFEQEIVVPVRATEASLQVGILDGVGVVEFDDLKLKNKNEKTPRSSKRHS